MPVGTFPNMRELNRRTVRGPVNPLDKSTLVSVYPRPCNFKNVTLSPGRWYLEAGSMTTPALLTIGPSSWFRDVGIDEPLIEIPQSSIQVAESLIKDYLNGVFGCNGYDSMPGLFFVPGKFTLNKIREEYGELLGAAVKHQMNYYRTQIKYADSLWARSNGNPLAVNEEMRLAARELGIQDREWMKETANVGMVRCPACGEFKSPDYPICRSCHSIDLKHPMAGMIKRVDSGSQSFEVPDKPENPFDLTKVT